MAAARQGEPLYGFADEYRSPVDYQTAARGMISLLSQIQGMTLHLGGIETLSRLELMRQALKAFGLDPERVQSRLQKEMSFRARRPADTSLDSRAARQLG
ncbi:sugar nucleotide-binding protein, partial [Arthrospira platensis SPKY1]|nr:sugar nucleotide-binding protein [Arthrospira platensis SPKY1]